MKSAKNLEQQAPASAACLTARAAFSPYLDGALTGVEMARVAEHLDGCGECAAEFEDWRSMQVILGEMGSAKAPLDLQRQLRAAIEIEREKGSYLPPFARILRVWDTTIAPRAVQGAGGFVAAMLLLGGIFRLFGPGVTVQANDDGLAHLVAPHYLYSDVPPTPVRTGRDVPVLVEAKVNTDGRVYDYAILGGPAGTEVRSQIAQNLLSSVFEPATVFGVPVDGHVMLTYMGVSVRG